MTEKKKEREKEEKERKREMNLKSRPENSGIARFGHRVTNYRHVCLLLKRVKKKLPQNILLGYTSNIKYLVYKCS